MHSFVAFEGQVSPMRLLLHFADELGDSGQVLHLAEVDLQVVYRHHRLGAVVVKHGLRICTHFRVLEVLVEVGDGEVLCPGLHRSNSCHLYCSRACLTVQWREEWALSDSGSLKVASWMSRVESAAYAVNCQQGPVSPLKLTLCCPCCTTIPQAWGQWVTLTGRKSEQPCRCRREWRRLRVDDWWGSMGDITLRMVELERSQPMICWVSWLFLLFCPPFYSLTNYSTSPCYST